jgi:ribosomal-protein-serine acetyltransferase
MDRGPTRITSLQRIETRRLVLRPWTLEDAPLRKRAYDESGAHPSRASAMEQGQTLEAVTEGLARLLAGVERGEHAPYAAIDRATGALVASAGLMARFGPGGLELGYWVHAGWARQGIATEVGGALTRVAFEVLGVPFMELRCGSSNEGSQGVARKLGYRLEASLPRRIHLPSGQVDDSLVFALHAEQYAASPAKAIAMTAFDASGARLV